MTIPVFKEIVDLSHEFFDNMINLGANHCAFWPLETFAGTRPLAPGLGVGYSVDLLPNPHRPISEELAEANEAPDLVNVHRFATSHLPESDDVKRQPGIVAPRAPAVDPELAQVEEDSQIEMPLIDVRADLTLV